MSVKLDITEVFVEMSSDALNLAEEARKIRRVCAALWSLPDLTEDEFIARLRAGIEQGEKISGRAAINNSGENRRFEPC